MYSAYDIDSSFCPFLLIWVHFLFNKIRNFLTKFHWSSLFNDNFFLGFRCLFHCWSHVRTIFFSLCHKLFIWTAFCFKMTLAVNIHYHSLAHCKTLVYKSSIESRLLNEYSRFTAVLLNRWTWHYHAFILQFKFTACSGASTVSTLKWTK